MGAYKCVCVLVSRHKCVCVLHTGVCVCSSRDTDDPHENVGARHPWTCGEELVVFKITFVLEAGVLLHFHIYILVLISLLVPHVVCMLFSSMCTCPLPNKRQSRLHRKVHRIFECTSSQQQEDCDVCAGVHVYGVVCARW